MTPMLRISSCPFRRREKGDRVACRCRGGFGLTFGLCLCAVFYAVRCGLKSAFTAVISRLVRHRHPTAGRWPSPRPLSAVCLFSLTSIVIVCFFGVPGSVGGRVLVLALLCGFAVACDGAAQSAAPVPVSVFSCLGVWCVVVVVPGWCLAPCPMTPTARRMAAANGPHAAMYNTPGNVQTPSAVAT